MFCIVDRSPRPSTHRRGRLQGLALALTACLLAPSSSQAGAAQTDTLPEPSALLGAGLGGLFALVLVGRRTDSAQTTRA